MVLVCFMAIGCGEDDGDDAAPGQLDRCELFADAVCPIDQQCVPTASGSQCVSVGSNGLGGVCTVDTDCGAGLVCEALGDGSSACQKFCDPEAEDSCGVDGLVCFDGDVRALCGCRELGACGANSFCVNGPSFGMCGPGCRERGDVIIPGGVLTDQCCNEADGDTVCQNIYDSSGFPEASVLAGCFPEANGAVCALGGAVGDNIQCLENRDCGEGELCQAADGEACDAIGTEKVRCLVCAAP